MGTKIQTVKAVRALKKLSFVEKRISSGKNFFLLFPACLVSIVVY